MKVLFVSNLFPNAHEPVRGVFNFHQMRHLAKLCEVRVVAPIAWFPIKGRYAPPAPVPRAEEIGGLRVYHPKHFYLPKIGRSLNPLFFALSLRALVKNIHREFPFDVIFVNWAYPDACGMAKVARRLGVPFVVSISGSDVNVGLKFRIRRRQILRMLAEARAVTVRSRALQKLLAAHGVPADKVHVVYNGVDPTMFRPKTEDRRPQTLLYVGRLSPEKGVADLLEALALLPQPRPALKIVGDGFERESLWQLATELGLDKSVKWLGWKRPDEIAGFMSAADLLCLPSHMEGVPNAALEAFACGLPVVAANVGGIPEIMTEVTGLLVPPHDPASFAAALTEALHRKWDRELIRKHAARFDWDENARQVFQILKS